MQELFGTLRTLLDDADGGPVIRQALVFATWRRIAGELLADHTAPVALEQKRLVVAVSSETWIRHLKELSGQMLYKLNAVAGASMVEFIEFTVDERAVKTERAKHPRVQALAEDATAMKDISSELLASAARIKDENLRDQFLHAAGNCLQRER